MRVISASEKPEGMGGKKRGNGLVGGRLAEFDRGGESDSLKKDRTRAHFRGQPDRKGTRRKKGNGYVSREAGIE